ncbi:MAG: PASTA domain-containing protein [Pontiellaceae bacterium]|jgi:hypothetical protein|nr:PASTA domain-containing protein [Pontiellaceae bacterium]
MKWCQIQMKSICILAGTLLVSNSLRAATSPVGDVVGKVTVGYQGWFSCVGDGSPRGNRWNHWAVDSSVSPRPGNSHFDLYPDVREYTTTYQTGYANLGNGSPAKLFSSYDPQVINKHVEWMQAYKIDTAALQRFGYDVFSSTNNKAFRDSVATKMKNACQTYGRKFYIMYDITDWSSFQSQIKQDWTNTITGSLGLTNSGAYAKQNGKPVVCIWGVGKEIGSSTSWTDVINFFKGKNCYVIIGIPRLWRTDDASSSYQYAHMLSPWPIGAYKTDSEIDSHGRRMRDDKALCDSRGQDYQPVVYPGFSWYNWKSGASKDETPRRHGDFLWRQFYNVRSNNIPSVYVAMFDEYDEGTAIAKAAETASMKPTNQWFLTLDYNGTKCSADFYLRLTGDGGDMVKSNIARMATHPTPHTGSAPPPSASCHIDTPTGSVTKNLGDTLAVTVSASDSDGVERVKIYLSGVEKMSDTVSPYEFNLALTNAGTFTLTAQVKDVLGNYTASDNSRTITVTGGTTTTVPWVTNLTLSAAGTSLTNAGLTVGSVSSNYHATIAAGKIFSQTPAGGTTVNSGSSVSLAVSLGPQSSGVTLLNEGFEGDFSVNWATIEAWKTNTTYKHSGSRSALADVNANNLYGKTTLNTAPYNTITVSFWYMDDDIDADDDVYLNLYNCATKTWVTNVFELDLTTEDTWTYKELTYTKAGAPQYFGTNFGLRVRANSIDTDENLWLDDVKVVVQ